MEAAYKDYVISDDKQRVNIQTVIDFLATSYWANSRPKETIQKSIENSICYGVYDKDRMIGFARIITDGATMYYLCDVFIVEEYRGQGISKKLIEIIANAPELESLIGLLGTMDAHGLYEQYGFERDAEKFMRRMSRH